MKERKILMKHLACVFNYKEICWIEAELGEFLDYDFPNNIAELIIAELKKYYSNNNSNRYKELDFCNYMNYAAFLHKHRDYKKIHKQMEKYLNPEFYLDFLLFSLRYVKLYDSCIVFPSQYDGKDYIPDEIVKKGIEEISSYCYFFSLTIENIKSNNTVKEISKQMTCLEGSVEYNGNNYVFSVPKTAEEIVKEAKTMKNCIASRLREYCGEEWIYVFCHNSKNAEESLFDAIINRKSGEPVWVISKGHVDIEGDNRKAFDIWWNEKLPLIDEICGKKAVGF